MLWHDLQTLGETIPNYVLIKKRRSTDAQYLLLTLCLEVQKRSLTNVLQVVFLKIV